MSPRPGVSCSKLLSHAARLNIAATRSLHSAEATAASPPLLPHPPVPTPEPHCSFATILPFLPYFLVAMETHVIYVPCVALETGASAARPGDPPLPLQAHSRALPVNGRGYSRAVPAAGLRPGPSASASVTQRTRGSSQLVAPGERR